MPLPRQQEPAYGFAHSYNSGFRAECIALIAKAGIPENAIWNDRANLYGVYELTR